ncbi:MAG: hypothetical protein Q4D99_06865 [Bacillota bacterium]|nr:hypothetical protein [Bacillota bacterium]
MSGLLIYYAPVILWAGFGLWLVVKGLLKYKNAPNEKDYRYKRKSVEEFARKFGILMAILGALLIIGAAVNFFGLPKIVRLIMVILMAADGAGMYYVYKKVLKPL